MFFVIGENNYSEKAFGEGETLEEAINDWATSGYTSGAIEEFNDHQPRVIRGEKVTIKIEYTFSVVEN